jgi:hypothetical protein
MKFKKILITLACALAIGAVDAKGSFSSGGGGSRGGFSSGARSSPSVSTYRPSAPAQSQTRTTTTVTRSYSGSYVRPGYSYGGWGMGYHYNNGLVTGMILGSMMHPYGTLMYTGPGMYYNNALLYPNGQVVNQQGYLVGNYMNGQFVPVENGGMVAQPVPADAQPVQQPQPVVIQQQDPLDKIMQYVGIIFMSIVLIAMVVIFISSIII